MMGSNRSLATRPLVLYPTAPGAMHAWQSDLLGYGKRSMKMRAFTNDPCLDQSTGPPWNRGPFYHSCPRSTKAAVMLVKARALSNA